MAKLPNEKELKKLHEKEQKKVKARQKKDKDFKPATNDHGGGSGLVPEKTWNKLKVKKNG